MYASKNTKITLTCSYCSRKFSSTGQNLQKKSTNCFMKTDLRTVPSSVYYWLNLAGVKMLERDARNRVVWSQPFFVSSRNALLPSEEESCVTTQRTAVKQTMNRVNWKNYFLCQYNFVSLISEVIKISVKLFHSRWASATKFRPCSDLAKHAVEPFKRWIIMPFTG